MTNTIAPPTLEELNEHIENAEGMKHQWGQSRWLDVELYCLYTVLNSPGAGAEPPTSARLASGLSQVGRTEDSIPPTGAVLTSIKCTTPIE